MQILKTGNTDLAFAKINSAIKAAAQKKSLLADLWNLRAKIWIRKGNIAAAVKDQTEAVKCFKSKFTLYSLASYQFKANDISSALQTLDDLNKLDVKFAPAWKLRANILRTNNKTAALQAVNSYLELRPQDKQMQQMKKELEQSLKRKVN